MVVEDDPCFRAIAELMLQRMNFKSVVAEEDREESWAHLNFMRFDFIFERLEYGAHGRHGFITLRAGQSQLVENTFRAHVGGFIVEFLAKSH